LGLLEHIPRIGATFVLAQHLSLSALSRPWPHGPNAAARPVKAVVRASSAMFGNLRSYGAAMKVIGNADRQKNWALA
jgi:hypothetical protein